MEDGSMRRTHVLSRKGSTPYPHMVVAVQATVSQQYLSESDDVGTMIISSWSANNGLVIDGHIQWEYGEYGDTVGSWWRYLERVLRYSPTMHIYSWQAREVMAALGLWDRIADGDYSLRMHDPSDRPDMSDISVSDTQGYVVLQGPPTIVAFRGRSGDSRVTWLGRSGDSRVTWLDPQNYGVKSIAVYGPSSADGSTTVLPSDGELWIGYTQCADTTHAVCDWLDCYYHALLTHRLGGPEHTAASQAMTAYRSRYMRHRIEIHDSEPAMRAERAALYGGRCECYYIGELHSRDVSALPGHERSNSPCVRYDCGPLYYLDVNAMYPYVAGRNSLPVKLQAACGRTDWHSLHAACTATAVVAAVQVKTEVPCVPVRIDNRVVYPVGTFDTVLCGPEILLASRCGARIKCGGMWMYETAPIYHAMVDELWSARQRYAECGDSRMRSVVKAVLNASFGKWAQRTKRWVDVPHILPLRPYMQWWEQAACGDTVQYRSIGWNVQRMEVLPEEQSDTFAAITAYINSLARVYLWELMQCAGDGNVYYCDTDSLICNQLAYDALLASGHLDALGLGKLKVVSQPDTVRIHGRQAYELDGQLTISGASGKVRKAGDAYIEELVAPPIGYYLAKCEAPGMERRIARVRVTRAYNLGSVREDGNVEPIRFGSEKTT